MTDPTRFRACGPLRAIRGRKGETLPSVSLNQLGDDLDEGGFPAPFYRSAIDVAFMNGEIHII